MNKLNCCCGNGLVCPSHGAPKPTRAERITAVLAHIDRELELCSKRTPGVWEFGGIDSIGGGSIYSNAPNEPGGGFCVASIRWDNKNTLPIHRPCYVPEADANGRFIASASRGHERALRDKKALIVALHSLLPLAERGLPEPAHAGPCTPESGCDGSCMDLAHGSEIISRAEAALDAILAQLPEVLP